MIKNKKIDIPGADGRLQSVGIIMDGNGRWAKARGFSRNEGHRAGAKAVRTVIECLRDLGVRHVTLYAFSTENWKRPKDEVDGIMDLIYGYLGQFNSMNDEFDASVRFIGDKSALPEKLARRCVEIEKSSQGHPNFINVALNYGGRNEIIKAVNEAIKEGCDRITEDDICRRLYTADSPDPDLIIRTGGDLRISNFLIWQSAYSELYFTDTLWPDFGREEMIKAAEEFYRRKRRFGGLDSEDTCRQK